MVKGAINSNASTPVPRLPLTFDTKPVNHGPRPNPNSVVPMKKVAVAAPRMRGITRSCVVAAATPTYMEPKTVVGAKHRKKIAKSLVVYCIQMKGAGTSVASAPTMMRPEGWRFLAQSPSTPPRMVPTKPPSAPPPPKMKATDSLVAYQGMGSPLASIGSAKVRRA